jgi:hypothetical protein
MKAKKITYVVGLLLSVLISPLAVGAEHSLWFDPSKHISIDKIQPGMKGYGLSIFYGTKIERFEVEVRDVIKNFEPKRDAILVNLSGQDLERTGVIQGMSGSPVYLKDPTDGKYKIAGAVAFGWSFSRPGPAICGVQPIEEMLAVPPEMNKKEILVRSDRNLFTQGLSTLAAGESESPDTLMSFDRFVMAGIAKDVSSQKTNPLNSSSRTNAGLVPLATPLGVSGLSGSTFTKLSTILSPMNLSLVKTGSGSATGTTTKPVAFKADTKAPADEIESAGVLAVPLVSGDMSLAAIGTVTDVTDNKLWGFGHAFFAQGPMELPIASGRIHAIIASLDSSFKLGSPFEPIGTLYSDQNTAVAGEIGPIPTLSPVTIRVNFDGNIKTYHYDMAMHEQLTPLLTMVCVQSSAVCNKELPELHTVKYSGTIDFGKYGKVEISNTSSNADLGMVLSDVAEPVELMMNNEFERVKFKKIDLSIEILPQSIVATIKQARLDQSEYKPGEKAKVDMIMTQVRGPEFIHTVEFTVPEDLPDGTYALTVGGLQTAMQADRQSNPQMYKPNTIEDLYSMIKRVLSFRSDRFFLSLNTREAGLGIRHYGLGNLPESKLNQLEEADPSLTQKFTTMRLEQIPDNYVVSGSSQLALIIARNK